jgi:hypothetical protein
MMTFLFPIYGAVLGVAAGFLISRVPASGKAAAAGLAVPAVAFGLGLAFPASHPAGILGTAALLVSAPLALGYAVHAYRSDADRVWALVGLLGGSLLALPALWVSPLYLVGIVAVVVRAGGAPAPQRPSNEQPFSFTVEEVSEARPVLGRVLLTGTVHAGSVQPGDPLTVRCRGGDTTAILEGIETTGPDEGRPAGSGKQVCLLLRGLRPGQVARGDLVVGGTSRPSSGPGFATAARNASRHS